MISSRKLLKVSRHLQKVAAIGNRRISSPRTNGDLDVSSCNTSLVANKGHFVIYTNDLRRFVMPLAYLNNTIFIELFKKSEEELGISSDGPITLPCDAVFMEFVLSRIQLGQTRHLGKVLINSIATSCCS